MIDSCAQIVHLEYFKKPRGISRKKIQSREKFPRSSSFIRPLLFLSLSLDVDFLLTIAVNDDERTCRSLIRERSVFARIANVRFPVLRSRCLVHMRVLLHVAASLPRFSRCFDVVTNKCELPFLFR